MALLLLLLVVHLVPLVYKLSLSGRRHWFGDTGRGGQCSCATCSPSGAARCWAGPPVGFLCDRRPRTHQCLYRRSSCSRSHEGEYFWKSSLRCSFISMNEWNGVFKEKGLILHFTICCHPLQPHGVWPLSNRAMVHLATMYSAYRKFTPPCKFFTFCCLVAWN